MKTYLLTISFFIFSYCHAQTLGNQNLIDISYNAGKTTKALYYHTSATGKVPLVVFYYGLNHEANKGVNVLLNQGPAVPISKGWKPAFDVLSVQTPAEADNGYFFSEVGTGWSHIPYQNNIITSALKLNPNIDVNRIYLIGISAGGGAVTDYVGYYNFTPQYKIAAVVDMSGTIPSVLSSYDPKQLILSNIINNATAFYGESAKSGDIHSDITFSLVDALNALKPGYAAEFKAAANCHCDSAWSGFLADTSALWNWLLTKTANNVVVMPPDTTHKDTAVVVTPPVSSHIIYPKKDAANGINLNGKVQPGDTAIITIDQSPVSVVSLTGFKGDSLHPVVIINQGGQVLLTGAPNFPNSGFYLVGSVGVHITGTGDAKTKYGFKIDVGGYAAVSEDNGRSANLEFDHLEITHKSFGFDIKQEVDCSDSLSFPNWYIHSISIHDNYVHNITLEGVYGLSTAPDGTVGTQHPTIICNGANSYNIPLRGYGWKIYNNIFDSTGRAAIQLSAHDLDTAEIYGNQISHCGSDPDIYQGNGISLGGHCRAYVHDNTINYTKKDGIQAFGAYNRIENNTVTNSGNSGMGQYAHAYNIYVVSQSGVASLTNLPFDTTQFIFKNNKLDKDTSIFVEYGNGYYSADKNVISGNTGFAYARPGIKYSTDTAVVVPPPVDTSITSVQIIFNKADGSVYQIPSNWKMININKQNQYVITLSDGTKIKLNRK